jgi:hypothetical protein
MNAATLVSEASHHQQVEEGAHSARGLPLFVIPCSRGGGFRASIRGHLLDLADPTTSLRHQTTSAPRQLRPTSPGSPVVSFVTVSSTTT